MHENSFLDVNTLVITRHAQERWKERGFRGTYGLLEELSKAQLFTEEVRGVDIILTEFMRVTSMYYECKEERKYFFTNWFIFVVCQSTLITCISRNSHVKYRKKLAKSTNKKRVNNQYAHR
ncbi:MULTISPECIES: hypothetical protein [Enterobacterales]|uniref:Uncharacterized protein n=7 Tax=Enterobacterales TaxID=91347 RepID=A0A7L8KA97_ECOLX|nr:MULTISPECIES: hypothetical protein [Enterobacterales]ELY4881609.1 hypothetical protein [Morganella morganii]SPY66723.1 Uncharacterised protein [Providencia stuartii]ALV81854.1 hypothetical protein AOY08_100139 [Providencia rettgeri]ELB1214778.1 hypothetical protein [Proteus mirabilis]ELR5094220.1 hypothetical protein [Providencia rettgeri]